MVLSSAPRTGRVQNYGLGSNSGRNHDIYTNELAALDVNRTPQIYTTFAKIRYRSGLCPDMSCSRSSLRKCAIDLAGKLSCDLMIADRYSARSPLLSSMITSPNSGTETVAVPVNIPMSRPAHLSSSLKCFNSSAAKPAVLGVMFIFTLPVLK